MYSPYGGETFLSEYVSSRRRYTIDFENRYREVLTSRSGEGTKHSDVARMLTDWAPLLDVSGDAFPVDLQVLHSSYRAEAGLPEGAPRSGVLPLEEAGSLDHIPTQQVLRSLLLRIVDWDNSANNVVYEWLSLFLKRFEVTKKLYPTYTPKLKPTTTDFRTLTNYVLLSLSLILYYQRAKNLKMLNGSLKLNDLVCSTEFELSQPEDLFLTILAMNGEVANVRQIADSRSITLPEHHNDPR